ncbi:hypothetical protein [Psychroserpens luteolus]|uniref:hypothetical protein n=1 Tax=Psychroserpens luteolus TaxID=2855840 RepID=UPI001E50A712|nr:hypothetical protein [Psychroserpens luteolus]MCD2260793.1 hypothetical protein [Psychroserpens luteolus]
MLWFKLKAGALQLTLFIAVVIALLLTAFILLVHTHKRFNIQTNLIIETTRNADKGIHYVLTNDIQINDSTTIDLQGEVYESLRLNHQFWGVYGRLTSVSKIKNNQIVKSALIGELTPDKDRIALYLQDNKRPLVVVGNTRIEGVSYLPKQGVKSGNISGQSYYGSQFIYGNIRTANKQPNIFTDIIKKINSTKENILAFSENQFLNIKSGKDYKNSFFKPSQIVFSNAQIDLFNVTMIGNIIIQSKTKISVDASTVLKDVILIAPEIEIRNNFKGNLQAFASDRLVVGERVQLNYPSALILTEKVTSQRTVNSQISDVKQMTIGSSSEIKGSLLYYGRPKLNNNDVQLELKENSVITGEVFCNQNLELKGTVFGSVYTNNFIAKQFGSIYQNHIYNGKIIINDLPKEYLGLSLNNSKKGVIKWLY